MTLAVTLIALKREVAAEGAIPDGRFFRGANVKLGNWRQVTVQKDHLPRAEMTCDRNFKSSGYTRESVQSPLVVLRR